MTVYTNWHSCCINIGEFQGFSYGCICKNATYHLGTQTEVFIFVPLSHEFQPKAESKNLKGLGLGLAAEDRPHVSICSCHSCGIWLTTLNSRINKRLAIEDKLFGAGSVEARERSRRVPGRAEPVQHPRPGQLRRSRAPPAAPCRCRGRGAAPARGHGTARELNVPPRRSALLKHPEFLRDPRLPSAPWCRKQLGQPQG